MSEWSEASRAGKAGMVTFWVLIGVFAPVWVPVWFCLKFLRI